MELADKHASKSPLVLDTKIIYYCEAFKKSTPGNNSPGNVLFGNK